MVMSGVESGCSLGSWARIPEVRTHQHFLTGQRLPLSPGAACFFDLTNLLERQTALPAGLLPECQATWVPGSQVLEPPPWWLSAGGWNWGWSWDSNPGPPEWAVGPIPPGPNNHLDVVFGLQKIPINVVLTEHTQGTTRGPDRHCRPSSVVYTHTHTRTCTRVHTSHTHAHTRTHTYT